MFAVTGPVYTLALMPDGIASLQPASAGSHRPRRSRGYDLLPDATSLEQSIAWVYPELAVAPMTLDSLRKHLISAWQFAVGTAFHRALMEQVRAGAPPETAAALADVQVTRVLGTLGETTKSPRTIVTNLDLCQDQFGPSDTALRAAIEWGFAAERRLAVEQRARKLFRFGGIASQYESDAAILVEANKVVADSLPALLDEYRALATEIADLLAEPEEVPRRGLARFHAPPTVVTIDPRARPRATGAANPLPVLSAAPPPATTALAAKPVWAASAILCVVAVVAAVMIGASGSRQDAARSGIAASASASNSPTTVTADDTEAVADAEVETSAPHMPSHSTLRAVPIGQSQKVTGVTRGSSFTARVTVDSIARTSVDSLTMNLTFVALRGVIPAHSVVTTRNPDGDITTAVEVDLRHMLSTEYSGAVEVEPTDLDVATVTYTPTVDGEAVGDTAVWTVSAIPDERVVAQTTPTTTLVEDPDYYEPGGSDSDDDGFNAPNVGRPHTPNLCKRSRWC